MRVSQRRTALLLALAWVGAGAGAAEARGPQLWPTLLVNAPIADEWRGSIEVVGRTRAGYPSGQLEARALIGRAVSERVTLWAGYAHVTTYAANGRTTIEQHALEQINWEMGAIGPARFSARTRFEQRFLQGSNEISWRLRQQLRLAAPIGRGGLRLVLWTEPFIDLNRTGAVHQTFDQMRNFAGISWPLAKHVDLETGYLSQYIHRPAGDTWVNAIPVSMNVRF